MISDTLLDEASALIEQRIGLRLDQQFRTDLRHILHALTSDPLELLHILRYLPETSPKWQRLIHALTIGETYFFRDTAMFRLLRSSILPQIIANRRQQADFRLHIWCAGCATGEEPLSVAILLHELLEDRARWHVNIIGTDLNIQALEQARAGVYRNWAFRHSPETFRGRYFDRLEGGWRIRPAVHEMVQFQHANLLTQRWQQQFDLILCRNVMIYFSPAAAQQLTNTLHHALLPEGWLLLGQTETLPEHNSQWIMQQFEDYRAYRHPASQAARPTPPAAAPVANQPGYREALQALRAEQRDEAETILRQTLAQQNDHRLHMLLAFILANRRALSEAHRHLDVALSIDPLLADAHYLRAILFLEEEHIELAQQALRSALYCQRDHALAAFMLGALYAREGQMDAATRAWGNARQAAAQHPPDMYLSDFSDMSAAAFVQLVTSQLDSLNYQ